MAALCEAAMSRHASYAFRTTFSCDSDALDDDVDFECSFHDEDEYLIRSTTDLLTPPRSPCDDYAAVQFGVSSSRCRSPECDDSPLVKDCMWSERLLPPGLIGFRGDSFPATDATGCKGAGSPQQTVAKAETVDLRLAAMINPVPECELQLKSGNTMTTSDFCAVNPSTVSCVTPSSTSDERVGSSATDMKSSSSSTIQDNSVNCIDDDDDSSEDVDVESVEGPSPNCVSSPPLQSSSGCLVRELLVLPPAASVLAHVNAMHNYSSVVTAPSDSAASACAAAPWSRHRSLHRDDDDALLRKLVRSAPHSPVSTHRGRLWRHKFADGEQLGSVSMPSSPAGGQVPHHHQRRSQPMNGHRRRPVAAGSRGGCSDSEDPVASPVQHHRGGTGGKRAMHNVLERRRRDHLKWNFEALRSVVPIASGNARMPKVAILRRARDHVRHLRAVAEKLEAERNRLRSLHQRWNHKFQLLVGYE